MNSTSSVQNNYTTKPSASQWDPFIEIQTAAILDHLRHFHSPHVLLSTQEIQCQKIFATAFATKIFCVVHSTLMEVRRQWATTPSEAFQIHAHVRLPTETFLDPLTQKSVLPPFSVVARALRDPYPSRELSGVCQIHVQYQLDFIQ